MNTDDDKIVQDGSGNPPAGDDTWQVPDGFTADMFDENHLLVPDVVRTQMDALRTDAAKFKKQAEDMRRKVSAKDALGTVEEYANGYKNDDFAKFANSETDAGEFLRQTLGNVDKIAKDNGLSLAQANAVKDGLYLLMQDMGVVDLRSPEESAAAQLELQQSILGDNASEIVKSNTDWIKEYGLFSDKEKEMLVLACEKGNPLINSVMHKFYVLHGKSDSRDIPVNNAANNDGLPPDSTLAAEYVAATPARRAEILQSRAAAGRKGKLPISAQ